ncbi:MAG: hypothetical protein AAF206_23280 [Bacteroidota bacterium]
MEAVELLKQAEALRTVMKQAIKIADSLHAKMPELEEPAMRAQCSVIRAFLRQTERQEEILTQMITAKDTGENLPVNF